MSSFCHSYASKPIRDDASKEPYSCLVWRLLLGYHGYERYFTPHSFHAHAYDRCGDVPIVVITPRHAWGSSTGNQCLSLVDFIWPTSQSSEVIFCPALGVGMIYDLWSVSLPKYRRRAPACDLGTVRHHRSIANVKRQ